MQPCRILDHYHKDLTDQVLGPLVLLCFGPKEEKKLQTQLKKLLKTKVESLLFISFIEDPPSQDLICAAFEDPGPSDLVSMLGKLQTHPKPESNKTRKIRPTRSVPAIRTEAFKTPADVPWSVDFSKDSTHVENLRRWSAIFGKYISIMPLLRSLHQSIKIIAVLGQANSAVWTLSSSSTGLWLDGREAFKVLMASVSFHEGRGTKPLRSF